MVLVGAKSDVGIRKVEPAVNITAAVSATHLPILKITPFTIPGSAVGSTVLVTDCHLVAP